MGMINPANLANPAMQPMMPPLALPMGVQAQGGPSVQSQAAPVNTPIDQWILDRSLELMRQIQHLPNDEGYMRHMGVVPVFRNGQEALQVIRSKGINVIFGDMGDSSAHAQWIAEQNTIMINQKYRGDTKPETLYAISEALYHEAGHAAMSGDNQSSIQEETNCLAMNTLANRFHQWQDPAYASSASSSPLIANGVALYTRLFFDPDPYKQALVNRIVEKYGDLPLTSPDHGVPMLPDNVPLAPRVASQAASRQARPQWTVMA